MTFSTVKLSGAKEIVNGIYFGGVLSPLCFETRPRVLMYGTNFIRI